MAQYRNGTVSVETGSATVHGINTNFVGNVAAGNLFSIVDENVWYEILSVNENGRITLTGNYVGATRGALAYAVQRDFTVLTANAKDFRDVAGLKLVVVKVP